MVDPYDDSTPVLLSELREVGVNLPNLMMIELPTTSLQVVRILMRHFGSPYSEWTRSLILRAIATPIAHDFWPEVVEAWNLCLCQGKKGDLYQALAACLGGMAGPGDVDTLICLIKTPPYIVGDSDARAFMVDGLVRLKAWEAIKMLQDDSSLNLPFLRHPRYLRRRKIRRV